MKSETDISFVLTSLLFKQECISVGFVPSTAVTVSEGGVCLGGICLGGVCLGGVCVGRCTPPHCGQNDRCMRKHYLSATTVADGKKAFIFSLKFTKSILTFTKSSRSLHLPFIA